jgi:hypothetical protein
VAVCALVRVCGARVLKLSVSVGVRLRAAACRSDEKMSARPEVWSLVPMEKIRAN